MSTENMVKAGKGGLTFASDWDSTIEYDRLTGVRYDNKLFFSKKPVPIGLIPEDGEYWFLAYEGLTDAEWESILNGTQQVGDSAKLGGKSAEEWGTSIDNIQTTSKAELKTAGWYRVAEYVRFDTNEPANGSRGNSCILAIKRSYISANNESHIILYSVTYNKMNIKPLMSQVNSPAITKTRITVEGNKSYLEVYYSLNTSNTVSFTVMMPQDYNYNWSAITPTLTEEIVDGVTVYDTCELSANISPTTTSDLANYLPLSGGEIKSNTNNTPFTVNCPPASQVFMGFSGNGGSLGLLGFVGADNPSFRSTDGKYLSLLHTGNKPSGTYTGNGESAVRTIETNGTGSAIAVWGKLSSGTTLSAIVLRYGTFYASNDATSPLYSDQMWKNDKGSLYIGSAMSTLFNVSGVQYEYAVL